MSRIARAHFRRISQSALPSCFIIYVTLCFLFGGASREGLHFHYFLQSLAALGVALLAISWPRSVSLKPVAAPIVLLIAPTLIAFLQCIPLPSSVWKQLPGRADILDGFESLGVSVTALPASLDVVATQAVLGYSLTPLFVLLICVRIGIKRLQRVALLLLSTLAVCSAALGLAQVFLSQNGSYYFYNNTNVGFPVGMFSNANHFASSMLMMMPFICLLLFQVINKRQLGDKRIALSVVVFSGFLIVFTGIIAAGSLAIYLILLPVLATTLIALRRRRANLVGDRLLPIVFISVLVFGVVLVASSPILSGLGETGSIDSPTSRYSMWSYTLSAINEYWPIGAGMGTYQTVIPKFEDPGEVTSRFIALAHNEYLQIAMELGVAGTLVILCAVIWFVYRAQQVWFAGYHRSVMSFRKMAVIGIAVFLLHSVVDYPGRTPAIASLIGLFVAIISVPERTNQVPKKEKLQQTNHLIL